MDRVDYKASSSEKFGRNSRIPYRALLSVLTVAFAFRITMQPLVGKWQISILPSFDTWHSEALPYPILFALQLLILGIMILGCLRLPHLGTSQRASRVLAVIGWIYVTLMVKRLIIGLFDLSDHIWFDGAVPTAFHFVLISYIMIMSHAFSEGKSKKSNFRLSRYLGYPFLIILSMALFFCSEFKCKFFQFTVCTIVISKLVI